MPKNDEKRPPQVCGECGGTGWIPTPRASDTKSGTSVTPELCKVCKGTGRL